MAHIGTNLSWLNQSNHGIHIRAIHIDLTAVVMDGGTNLTNRFFKHAMGRRIGHHEGPKTILIFLTFRF